MDSNAKSKDGLFSLNVGDTFFIAYGTTKQLPEPAEGYHWELDTEIPTGRYYKFCKNETPSEFELKKENEELRQINADRNRENVSLRRDLNKAIQEKTVITEAFDKRGIELEEVRTKAAQEITKAAEKIDTLHRENKEIKEHNDQLMAIILKPTETDKESGMAEQSPEAKAYEDIHTRKMEAETRSIELDNEDKAYRNKFKNDYPEFVWRNHSNDINNLYSSQSKTFWAIVVGGTALLVNEVIQWVNL